MRLPTAFLAFLLSALTAQAAFRASVVKVDITPKTPQWLMGYGARKSTGVHDPIFHKVAVLDDGKTQVFLVSSDLCLFSPTVYDEVAAELKSEMAIEPRNFWWTVTHSHSTPEVGPPGMYDVLLKGRSDHPWDRDYYAFVKSALVAAIREARAKLEPARVAIGTGMSRANINRRARDLDGTISLGLNPDGITDRQVGVIRLERPDGQPLGLIANYAMHATVLGSTMLQVSADAPGVVATHVEKELGAPMLFINGAAGNLAPIYTTQELRRAHLGEFRVLLGQRILETNTAMGPGTANVQLLTMDRWIETPRKPGLEWTNDLSAYTARNPAGVDLVRMPIRLLRLNDTAIWAAPVELFCEIALAVRHDSPFRHTFYFGYTNGWLGYLPTAQTFKEGGYELRTSPFSEHAERDVINAVSTLLHALPRRSP